MLKPDECRDMARECELAAARATSFAARNTLTETARRWRELAGDLPPRRHKIPGLDYRAPNG